MSQRILRFESEPDARVERVPLPLYLMAPVVSVWVRKLAGFDYVLDTERCTVTWANDGHLYVNVPADTNVVVSIWASS